MDVTGIDAEIEYHDKREGDIMHSAADVEKISEDLGFAAEVNLREGIAFTENINKFRKNIMS